MDELEQPPSGGPKQSGWTPDLKKLFDFVLKTSSLTRSVDHLKSENKKLRGEVNRLQRQVDELAGQVKAINVFIQQSINSRAEESGERAALKVIERFFKS